MARPCLSVLGRRTLGNAAALVVAVGIAGCLSTPGPATGDGGSDGPHDGGIDAMPDAAGTARCRRDARPAGRTWPPTGADAIDAYAVQLADIDGDELGDLVVTVAGPTAGSARPAAVYVLYGPVSPTAPEYHVALDLDDDAVSANLQPWASSLDDLDGDGCLDLTVAGPPTAGHTVSAAAVFRHDGSAAAWTGAAHTSPLTFEPQPGPTMVAWGDLTANADRDLVVADLYSIDVLPGSTVTTLGASLTVPRPICNNWDNINALRLQPRVSGRDRLLVFGHYRTNHVTFDELGTPTVSDECTPASQPITRGAATIDLDGEAPLDLLTGGGASLGAHVITGDALPAAPAVGAMTCPNTPRGGGIEGFAVGDLGGSTAPDAVVIDRDPGDGTSYACLVMTLSVDVGRTAVMSNGVSELALGAGVVRTLVIGDTTTTDGRDVRAWILDVNGDLHCVRRTTGANTLTGC